MDATALQLPRRTTWRRAAVVGIIACSGVAALGWAIVVTHPEPAPGIPPIAPGIAYATPLARMLSTAAGISCIGAVLLTLLLRTAGDVQFASIADRARTVGIGSGVIWLTVAVTTWWLQAAAISGGPGMSFLGLVSYVGDVSSGGALLVAIVAACTYIVVAVARPQPRWAEVCLGTAMVGLAAVPVTGHASQGPAPWLTIPAICLHLCALSLWVGGLAFITVLTAGHRPALTLVLPRFSTLAGLCIATVGISGLLLVGPRLTNDPTPAPHRVLDGLVGTPAGWLILGKLAGIFVLAATGGYIRQRLLPAVRRQEPIALATLATAELLAMTVTIALATALARPL